VVQHEQQILTADRAACAGAASGIGRDRNKQAAANLSRPKSQAKQDWSGGAGKEWRRTSRSTRSRKASCTRLYSITVSGSSSVQAALNFTNSVPDQGQNNDMKEHDRLG
jgi:hypothetical protein